MPIQCSAAVWSGSPSPAEVGEVEGEVNDDAVGKVMRMNDDEMDTRGQRMVVAVDDDDLMEPVSGGVTASCSHWDCLRYPIRLGDANRFYNIK